MNKPTYEELLEKVKEYEIQEKVFKTIIEQMEKLYSEIASNQTEIEKQNERLREERGKLNAILENIAEGLVVVDRKGIIITANEVFCKYFGKDISTIINSDIRDVIDNPDFLDSLTRTIKPPGDTTTRLIRLNDERYIKNVTSAIRMDGILYGAVSTFRDVTHEVKLDEMKTSFLSTVSHELRTPLTSVLGFAKIIMKRLDEVVFPLVRTDEKKVRRAMEQVRSNLEIIVSEGERLTSLINDVLDIAKIESGRIEWKKEEMDIREVIESAFSATTALFESKGLYQKKDLPGHELMVKGDRDRLIQVVTNLLSNAVKFTDSGGITCRVRESEGKVRCEVEDTGVGLPEGMLEAVFEKFRQVGDTLTDRPKGTGLGLPICREIIEHHGGRIWAENREGGGSRFVFELPAGKGVSEGDEIPPEHRDILLSSIENRLSEDDRGAKSILVVDDDISLRVLLRQYLEERGYRTEEAGDAREAIRKARQKKPDLILLDIMMPDLSGYDVLRVLKHDEETRDIPVIVVSALEDRERGLILGAEDYITKPVDEKNLHRSIMKALEKDESLERPRILIIDTNEQYLHEIAQLMLERNYDVIRWKTTDDIEHLTRDTERFPDLVLVDAEAAGNERFSACLKNEKARRFFDKAKILFMIKP